MSVQVIGGGPAGAAAAIMLAREGRAVRVSERERGPAHKVCGDFLSTEALEAAHGLGVRTDVLGASVITHVRLVTGRVAARAALPFAARGLTRRALDEALLARAAEAGADVRRGDAVAALARGDTETVLLATGKHALRGAPRQQHAGPLVGFKTYLALAPAQTAALRGHVEIVAYRGGYAGLQLVERDEASLCLLADRAQVQGAGGFDGLIAALRRDNPHLDARLDGAAPLLDRPLAIAGLAYGAVHAPDAAESPWLYRLGDQAAVIPSLAGDGVGIALHTGRLAATALIHGADAHAYHARLRADLRGQVRRAHAVQQLLGWAAGRYAAALACVAAPGLLRAGARATRIPARSRQRVQYAAG